VVRRDSHRGEFHYLLGADVMGQLALVLTPDPTLPQVD
jgi:hypothetical protein